jgi:rhomboid protease GluP
MFEIQPPATIRSVEKRRMCPNCRAFITTGDKVCPYCEVQLDAPIARRRSPGPVAGFIPHAHFTTVLILLINTGLFAAMLLRSSKTTGGLGLDLDGQTLFDFGAKDRRAIAFGQWWRLITAGFLHGGLMHILMNSWVLFDLGAQTEEFYGTARMLAIYFAATVGGFWASAHFAHLSVGASAGIFGLIGAMIAFGIKERSHYGTALRSFYMRWAMYGLVLGFIIPNIDMAAHLGGLAAGFAVGYLAGSPTVRPGPEQLWRGIAALTVVVTAFAFIAMFVWLTKASAQPGF